ncbi:hypothetical protein, partial [Pseudomonas syringae]|uniref:hypothetical protein n=1 Tax=Pseudomonas syringae TaxID=317 RepID=UPI001F409FF2
SLKRLPRTGLPNTRTVSLRGLLNSLETLCNDLLKAVWCYRQTAFCFSAPQYFLHDRLAVRRHRAWS